MTTRSRLGSIVIGWSGPGDLIGRILALALETIGCVIIDESDRLHPGIGDRWANEFEAFGFECLGNLG
jgi:hypothetical protein